jgi:hypothetical protein
MWAVSDLHGILSFDFQTVDPEQSFIETGF